MLQTLLAVDYKGLENKPYIAFWIRVPNPFPTPSARTIRIAQPEQVHCKATQKDFQSNA